MNGWSLENTHLVQPAHITYAYTESRGEGPYPSTHSRLIARAGMDLEIRVFRFFLLVKSSCEHYP